MKYRNSLNWLLCWLVYKCVVLWTNWKRLNADLSTKSYSIIAWNKGRHNNSKVKYYCYWNKVIVGHERIFDLTASTCHLIDSIENILPEQYKYCSSRKKKQSTKNYIVSKSIAKWNSLSIIIAINAIFIMLIECAKAFCRWHSQHCNFAITKKPVRTSIPLQVLVVVLTSPYHWISGWS